MAQREGVMNIPAEERTIQTTASAFDPKPLPRSSFGTLSSPSALFSPDVDPSQGGGTLPSGGFDMSAFTKGDITNADILKAIMPVSQVAPLQMPASLTRQIPGAPPLTLQHDPNLVGKGSGRAEGIGNVVSATANILTSFKLNRDRQRQEADATKVQRLMEAQQGIAQADQVLAVDPQNKAALATKQQNQTLIQGMFQDPKFVKTVEKGFQVSLTDPSQNKTPEHGVINRALELFKNKQQPPLSSSQASAAASRFGAAQPQMMAPNVLAQQQMQYKILQQQQWQKYITAMLPRMFSAQASMDRASFVQNRQDIRQMNEFRNKAEVAGQKFATDQSLALTRHKYRLDEIGAHVEASKNAMFDLWQMKSVDPTALFKAKTEFATKMATDERNLDSSVASIMSAKAAVIAAQTSALGGDEKAKLQEQEKWLDSQLNSLYKQQENLQVFKGSWYQQMKRLEEISAGGGGQSGPRSGTPTEQPGPGGAGAFNPQFYLGNVPPGLSGAPEGGGTTEENSDDEDEDIGGISYSPY